jgi:prepilin-type N-terminal cleavage/methylation domain-containing protein
MNTGVFFKFRARTPELKYGTGAGVETTPFIFFLNTGRRHAMPVPPARNAPASRGFTLIEVLVASTLLAVFVTMAVGSLVQTARVIDRVRQRTTASTLAMSRIEHARHVAFSEIIELAEDAPGTVIDFAGLTDQDGAFLRRTTINAITEDNVTVFLVRVDVWPRDRRTGLFPGGPETVETMIAEMPRSWSE